MPIGEIGGSKAQGRMTGGGSPGLHKPRSCFSRAEGRGYPSGGEALPLRDARGSAPSGIGVFTSRKFLRLTGAAAWHLPYTMRASVTDCSCETDRYRMAETASFRWLGEALPNRAGP